MKITTGRLHAAIDSFEGEIFFAVGEAGSGKILLEDSRRFDSRNSSGLLGWMSSLLGEKGLSLGDISMWTAGSGPSSFTVLRVISSLVSGMTYGNEEVRARAIPSACAIAAAASRFLDSDKITVLFPTPGKKIFVQDIDVKNGFKPLSPGTYEENCPRMAHGNFATYAKNREGALEFLSHIGNASETTGPVVEIGRGASLVLIARSPVAELIRAMPDFWERSSLRDLIYLRPPVEESAG